LHIWLSVDRTLLTYLDVQRKQVRTAIDLEFIVMRLSAYASSAFFNGTSDPEAVFLLVRNALKILFPDCLLKPTRLTGYPIRILGRCLYKLQNGPHVDEIIAKNIAILIINLIGRDNLQFSPDCSTFSALASFCGRGICFQLCDADAFNVISSALLSSRTYSANADLNV
jgi:hypothetical protein